jgi:hypothetical protein
MRLVEDVSGELRSDKALSQLVDRANQIIRELIGDDGPEVIARWSLQKDEKQRQVVILDFSDFKGRTTLRFDPDGLKNPRDRIHGAWGSMLNP